MDRNVCNPQRDAPTGSCCALMAGLYVKTAVSFPIILQVTTKTNPRQVEGNSEKKKKQSENRTKGMTHETKVFVKYPKPGMSSDRCTGSPRTQKDSYDKKGNTSFLVKDTVSQA